MSQSRVRKAPGGSETTKNRASAVKATGDNAPSGRTKEHNQRSRSKNILPKSMRYDLENALVSLCDVWFEDIKPHLIRNNIKLHVDDSGVGPASGDHSCLPAGAPGCSHDDPGAAPDLQLPKSANFADCCSMRRTASRAPCRRPPALPPSPGRRLPPPLPPLTLDLMCQIAVDAPPALLKTRNKKSQTDPIPRAYQKYPVRQYVPNNRLETNYHKTILTEKPFTSEKLNNQQNITHVPMKKAVQKHRPTVLHNRYMPVNTTTTTQIRPQVRATASDDNCHKPICLPSKPIYIKNKIMCLQNRVLSSENKPINPQNRPKSPENKPVFFENSPKRSPQNRYLSSDKPLPSHNRPVSSENRRIFSQDMSFISSNCPNISPQIRPRSPLNRYTTSSYDPISPQNKLPCSQNKPTCSPNRLISPQYRSSFRLNRPESPQNIPITPLNCIPKSSPNWPILPPKRPMSPNVPGSRLPSSGTKQPPPQKRVNRQPRLLSPQTQPGTRSQKPIMSSPISTGCGKSLATTSFFPPRNNKQKRESQSPNRDTKDKGHVVIENERMPTLFDSELINIIAEKNDKRLKMLFLSPDRSESSSTNEMNLYTPIERLNEVSSTKNMKPWR